MISFSHFLPELELMPEKRALDALDERRPTNSAVSLSPMGFCLFDLLKGLSPPYISTISVEVVVYIFWKICGKQMKVIFGMSKTKD